MLKYGGTEITKLTGRVFHKFISITIKETFKYVKWRKSLNLANK